MEQNNEDGYEDEEIVCLRGINSPPRRVAKPSDMALGIVIFYFGVGDFLVISYFFSDLGFFSAISTICLQSFRFSR